MKTSKFFEIFTGCDEGEVRAYLLHGCEQHRAAEALVAKGFLQRHQSDGERTGYSLTAAGKVKADARVARIG